MLETVVACFSDLTFVLALTLGILVFIISQTDILHSVLRGSIFKDFLITKSLPNGAGWDLSKPSLYGLPASTVSLRIPLTPGSLSYLGAWYVEPEGARDKAAPTVLYLHGISQTRGYQHRVSLYKVLLAAGFPVLAIDYRGFADSSQGEDISERTVVEDAQRAFTYLREVLGAERVLVWGHSQGAAIATHMVAALGDQARDQVRLVLESPYNTLKGQISVTRRWHERLVLRMVGLRDMDMQFRTVHWLPRVQCPVLILHAMDDPKVPARLSQDLIEKARVAKADIVRLLLDEAFGFGHNDIHRFEGLAKKVSQFWAETSFDSFYPDNGTETIYADKYTS